MPFVECAQARANCASTSGPTRSLATRLWTANQAPGTALLIAAGSALASQSGPAGRVESLGAFEDPALEQELKEVLPEPLATAAKPRMEWYGCRGAFFHNDAHYDDVLFGVWSIAGPPRDLVFPRLDCRLPARIGSIVVFDPFEPHAVLDAGAERYCRGDYEGAPANLFLGFEIALTPEVRDAFGIEPAHALVPTLSSRIAINPETGALVTSGV